jgi:hypothetical protein
MKPMYFVVLRWWVVTIGSSSAGREVASEVLSDIDASTPLFFLSYARSGRRDSAAPNADPGAHVLRFFNDLSTNVAELISRRTGADPGFIDRSIPAGHLWSRELLTAVGTCQVFVALLSASYLECDWCAREWDAFSRREVVKMNDDASPHEAGIVPVIWAPVREETHPPAIRAIERFSPTGLRDPDIAANYEKEGIFGLLQMGLNDDYQTVVWKIARRIAEICYDHRVRPRTFEFAELRNIFGSETP